MSKRSVDDSGELLQRPSQSEPVRGTPISHLSRTISAMKLVMERLETFIGCQGATLGKDMERQKTLGTVHS